MSAGAQVGLSPGLLYDVRMYVDSVIGGSCIEVCCYRYIWYKYKYSSERSPLSVLKTALF